MTNRVMKMNQLAMQQSLHRLATARRINRGGDDPAGLIATMSMDATLAALEAESSANQRAINIASTADAALGEVSGLLNEAKALATANANDAGLSDAEKQANQLEIDSILDSVDRIAQTTHFNGQKLLDGSGAVGTSGQKLKIDSASTSEIGGIEIDGTDYTLSDLRSGKALDTTDAQNATQSSEVLDTATSGVATARGKLGAFSRSMLEPRVRSISAAREHMLATVSMIRDTDYSRDISATTRAQLLERSSMLLAQRQADRLRSSLLSLLA